MDVEEDDDDLYGDLGDVDGDSLLRKELEETRAAHDSEAKAMRSRIAELEADNKRLKDRCGNLEKNMSSLFKTAKLELERKNQLIQRLEESSSSSSGGGRRGRR
eukprot:g2424.t1